jgi:hypothetical protein
MTLLLLLLAAVFLPLYPLSMLTTSLLQRGAPDAAPSRLGSARAKAALMILWPVLGTGLLSAALALADERSEGMLTALAVWGGATSVLYAFRLLSARDAHIWMSQLFASALALIWVGAAHGVSPLLPALGLAAPMLPLLFLFRELSTRFGIARSGLYRGLGLRMPLFSGLFIVAALMAVAVPLSPSFFAIAEVAMGGVAANEALTLVPVGLSWLLWTWAGVNLLSGIVFGVPREDLIYNDMARPAALRFAAGMAALALLGLLLVEVAL